MKPDEHKKKKNAQYKKKHGIVNKNKDVQSFKDVKGPGKKEEKSYEAGGARQKPNRSQNDHTKTSERKLSTSDSSDSNDDYDQEKITSSKPSFQRRKLVSNWDRYDLPPDEEPTKAKGENFSKLLLAAGSSSSQFRFKEEEEDWTTGDQTDILSLDLQDLSSSVDCVPLYKVLRLNKDLFSAEQIEEYDSRSSENQRKYKERNSLSTMESTKQSDINDRKPSCQLNIESNALDELLDSVVLEPSSEAKEKPQVMPEQSRILSSLENDLDDLLSSDNVEVKQRPAMEKKNLKDISKSQESAGLEDWLDSVLDS